jgi:proteic killer suppression protein
MEVDHDDDQLDRVEHDKRATAGHGDAVDKAFRRRMQQIRSAADERDFYALKSLHFEKLKGPRKHQHSMRLNDQWRLILELRGEGSSKRVGIIEIDDYH